MVVQHNLTAMNANRYLGINNSKLGKSLEKLSSGYAINRAGDNAAGLAVSEKMRSQIAGMTQGVKNAQDGISMVQTFEGALTETHSILQRMKTLADQMANGSYDDPIDRTAAQQEFLQLNDEINQIADTDFNGVIVLNGGKMADGLKAVDGMFDYANKAGQVKAANDKALADAQAKAQKSIDAAQKVYDTAKTAYDDIEKRDLSNNGDAAQWNTVDNSKYTKDVAKDLFGEDHLNYTPADDGEKSPESFDVTFTATVGADGKITWAAGAAKWTNNLGDEKTQTLTEIQVVSVVGNDAATKNNGGFKVGFGATAGTIDTEIANAIVDVSEIKSGDTVTLTFTNTAANTYAPDNIGIDNNSFSVEGNDSLKALAAPKVALGKDVTDANMTQKTADMLKKLDESTISYTYNGDKIRDVKISDSDLQIEESDTTGIYNVFYTIPGEGEAEDTKVVLATVTPTAGKAAVPASTAKAAAATVTGALDTKATDDATVTLEYKEIDDGAGGKKKAWTADGSTEYNFGGNAGATGLGQAYDGKTIADFVSGTASVGDKVTLTATANSFDVGVTYTGVKDAPATKGSVSFGVALDAFNYDAETTGPTVKAGKDKDIDSSVTTEVDKAYYEARDALNAAKAAYPKTLADLGDDYKVSTSDAFNKSEAKMTYTDSITLQVGARTKDAVNFTFQYASTSIGDLKADLDCTASGLGTDKLNINTQEDANYAIDKIDQAINKVSLIRGTFGAIQNRLDHKIDNMNVSIENLTSAESQIRDTNMAEEMMNFTKQQILAQASQAMLAQANQLPQNVLSLLR